MEADIRAAGPECVGYRKMNPLTKSLANCLSQKYAPPRTIAIDVDSTLYVGDWLDCGIVEFARRKHAEGFEIIVWSARGREYARQAAEYSGLAEICTAISKPGYIVDDQGWNWIRWTREIRIEDIRKTN